MVAITITTVVVVVVIAIVIRYLCNVPIYCITRVKVDIKE